MEYSIKRVVTEKWEVSKCSCGAEPEILDRVSIHDSNEHHISVKCPECQKMGESGSYIEHYNEGSINGRYNATMKAIASWENLEPRMPRQCKACNSKDVCLSFIINNTGAMRCLRFAEMKEYCRKVGLIDAEVDLSYV